MILIVNGSACCPVCGVQEILGMCPLRYVSDHSQTARDRAECVAYISMLSDGRDKPNKYDWQRAWTRMEPPLTIITWPG